MNVFDSQLTDEEIMQLREPGVLISDERTLKKEMGRTITGRGNIRKHELFEIKLYRSARV